MKFVNPYGRDAKQNVKSIYWKYERKPENAEIISSSCIIYKESLIFNSITYHKTSQN